MIDGLRVVLFQPKFAQNVGAAARACANMGCGELVLVAPRDWDLERALPLATPKGEPVLRAARVVDELEQALAGCAHVYGTTARTGGWRTGLLTPRAAAERVAGQCREGARVALLFGPEDRGLTNAETEVCGQLVTIPTAEASSLNLAQAVLLLLYECFLAAQEAPRGAPREPAAHNLATHAEQELLFAAMREALLAIGVLKDQNTDYWMLPVRRFVQRTPLRRAEFNMLMGVCRQVRWVAGRAGLLWPGNDPGREPGPDGTGGSGKSGG